MFSSDSMAYTSPYYTYDKRFDRSQDYKCFLFDVWDYFGIECAKFFFTEAFRKDVDCKNIVILDGIRKIFFNKEYLQWT